MPRGVEDETFALKRLLWRNLACSLTSLHITLCTITCIVPLEYWKQIHMPDPNCTIDGALL